MKKLLTLCIVSILFVGCGPESEVEPPEEKGPLSMTINGEVFNYFPADIITSTLSLSTPNTFALAVRYSKEKTNPNTYGIVFGFTDNEFVEASLSYVKEDGKIYRTADFNPLETFSIKNFKFDENAKTVSFEYEGKMYESLDEVNTSSKSITVKGKIDTKITWVGTGSFAPLPYAKFTTDDYTFSTVRGFTSRDDALTVFYMNCLTNHGERLQLALDQRFFASSYPITYTFDLDDTVNRLTFMKFIGSPRGTAQDVLRAEDWKSYPAKGTLTLDKISHDHYEGTFSIEVYDGTKLLHKTDNGAIVYPPNKFYPLY
ncbi:MAG: hypothetical protein ACOX19_10285 [Fermentimonas sp.]|jgi:hypothetical protein